MALDTTIPFIGSIASLAEVKRLVGVPISLTFSSVSDVPPQECAIETIPRLRVLSALATPVIVDLGELISICLLYTSPRPRD